MRVANEKKSTLCASKRLKLLTPYIYMCIYMRVCYLRIYVNIKIFNNMYVHVVLFVVCITLAHMLACLLSPHRLYVFPSLPIWRRRSVIDNF